MNKNVCLIVFAVCSLASASLSAMDRQGASSTHSATTASATRTWKDSIKNYVHEHNLFSIIAGAVLTSTIARDFGGPNVVETVTSYLSYVPRTLLATGILAIWGYAIA